MTKITVYNIAATLTGWTWSCENDAIRRMLEAATKNVSVHGGVPNVENAIVIELAKLMPIEVVERSPSGSTDAPPGILF